MKFVVAKLGDRYALVGTNSTVGVIVHRDGQPLTWPSISEARAAIPEAEQIHAHNILKALGAVLTESD